LKAKNIKAKYDANENNRPGWKFAEYEMKGIPVRIAIGLKDIENNVVEVARRDTKTKEALPIDGIANTIENLLDEIQQSIYQKAKEFQTTHITAVNSWEEFIEVLDTTTGFISAYWDGTAETENQIKEKTKATIRCIPLGNPLENGNCILTGKPSSQRVLFARAY